MTIAGYFVGAGFGIPGSGAALAATTNDIYQLVRNDSEETIKTSATVDNVHVENSYKIVTPWIRYGYSFYLNHINSDTRNVIKGSTLGVSFEWEVHNLSALFGIGGESGKHLDVGATIFSDLNSHPLIDEDGNISKTGVASICMITMYVLYRYSLILRFGL